MGTRGNEREREGNEREREGNEREREGTRGERRERKGMKGNDRERFPNQTFLLPVLYIALSSKNIVSIGIYVN